MDVTIATALRQQKATREANADYDRSHLVPRFIDRVTLRQESMHLHRSRSKLRRCGPTHKNAFIEHATVHVRQKPLLHHTIH
jgi:hypothetical protein